MDSETSGIGRAGAAIAKTAKAPFQSASRAAERARQRPWYTVAIVAGALVGIAWIGWAIYVTTENGATAGLGVLLSWPVLLGALALIAAPFVLTAMLLRNRDSSEEDPPQASSA